MSSKVMLLHRDLLYHGGVVQSYLTLARCYDRQRLSVSFGSFRDASPEVLDILNGLSIPHIPLGDGYAGSTYRLKRVIDEQELDVILTGSFKSYLVAKMAALGTKVRIVYRIPFITFQQDIIRRSIFKFLARNDTLIFISKAVQNAHDYPTHRGNWDLIYNGVIDEPADALRDIRSELGVAPDSICIGYLAEFIAWKHHETLLFAFAKLIEGLPMGHLIFIGTGETLVHIKALSVTLGIEDRVHFLGVRQDARRLLSQLDVYAHPAVGEAFGRAIVEAMLAARPIVGADAGAIPELLEDQVSGILVKPADADSMTDGLKLVLADPTRAAEMGRSARQQALVRFPPELFVERTTDVLDAHAKMKL